MKLIFAAIMVLVAMPVMAAQLATIPTDGNGNVGNCVWNGTAWIPMSDSITVDGITDTINVSAYIYGGALQSIINVAHDTIDHIAPMTTTTITTDTELTGTTFDTFTLSSGPYEWVYVSSDTDIIVALSAAEAAANSGDVVYAGMTIPYNFSTSAVYIRTLTGLAATGKHIAVRGMK